MNLTTETTYTILKCLATVANSNWDKLEGFKAVSLGNKSSRLRGTEFIKRGQATFLHWLEEKFV